MLLSIQLWNQIQKPPETFLILPNSTPPSTTEPLFVPPAPPSQTHNVPPPHTAPPPQHIPMHEHKHPCQSWLSLRHTLSSILKLIVYPISSARLVSPAILQLLFSALLRIIIGHPKSLLTSIPLCANDAPWHPTPTNPSLATCQSLLHICSCVQVWVFMIPAPQHMSW